MIHMKPFDQAWTLLKQTSSEAARYYFQNKNMNHILKATQEKIGMEVFLMPGEAGAEYLKI